MRGSKSSNWFAEVQGEVSDQTVEEGKGIRKTARSVHWVKKKKKKCETGEAAEQIRIAYLGMEHLNKKTRNVF